MGRMKEIDAVMRSTDEHLADIDRKMDTFLHLMSDMVKMESKIEGLEEKIDRQLQHLTSTLVQMAMVKAGESTAAVQHSFQSRFITPPAEEKETPDDDDDWAEGCDTMDIL